MTGCYSKESVGGVFWINVGRFQVVTVSVAKKQWLVWHTPEDVLIKIQSWASEILLHYNISFILLKIKKQTNKNKSNKPATGYDQPGLNSTLRYISVNRIITVLLIGLLQIWTGTTWDWWTGNIWSKHAPVISNILYHSATYTTTSRTQTCYFGIKKSLLH